MDIIEEKLTTWLSNHPNSDHPIDQERYFAFIDVVVAHDEKITANWLRAQLDAHNTSLDEQQVNRLVAQFEVIVSYGKHRANTQQ